MPRSESVAPSAHRREQTPQPSPERERKPHSALVKNEKGEVVALRADEQLVTKTEAYRGVAARLHAINEELKDIAGAGHKGFEKREAELNAEASRLIDYMDKMDKGVTEEEAREAFHEGRETMVENPFYSETATELGEEDLEEEEPPMEVKEGELIYELPTLRSEYQEMMVGHRVLDRKIARLEGIQRTIVQTISRMMEPGFKHRQALQQLEREAMSIEDYREMGLPLLGTEIQEAGDREEIRKKRLPQMLDAVTGQITRLSEQKVKLGGEMGRTVKKLRELEKEERAARALGRKKAA